MATRSTADVVKSRRERGDGYSIGDRISVLRTFFDTKNSKYSLALPEDIERLHGTVKHVFSATRKLSIFWDVDHTTSSARFADVQRESTDLAVQVMPGSSCDPMYEAASDTSDADNSTDFQVSIAKGKNKRKGTEFRRQCQLLAQQSQELSKDDQDLSEDDQELSKDDDVIDEEDEHISSDDEISPSPKKLKVKIAKPKSSKQASKNANKNTSADKLSDSSSSSSEEEEPIQVPEPEPKKGEKVDPYKFKVADIIIDPRVNKGVTDRNWGPRLNIQAVSATEARVIDHFMLYSPISFFEDNMIPSTNVKGMELFGDQWQNLVLPEFLKYFSLIISMEVQKLPDRHSYWSTCPEGPFPAYNYGQYMTRRRFNQISASLDCRIELDLCFPLTKKETMMYKTVTFMNACNKRFQQALTPGNRLTLDESMIKGFHKDLPAKIKILRKPRPVGNEIKDLCDSVTK